MKKRFFTTLAIFASLTLAACAQPAENVESQQGEQTTSQQADDSKKSNSKHTHTAAEGAAWQSDATSHWHDCVENDGGKVDKANHDFGEKYDEVAATCAKEGSYKQKCTVCGYVKEATVSKLDHSWDAGVSTGNCGEAGKTTYTCTVCGTTKEETSGYIQHAWTVTGKVEAGDGGLEYNLVKCSKCNKDGLMVAVKNADGTNNMTVTGSPKTAPEGCVKLGANNDSMTAVIKLEAAKTGKLYIRGSMDYWYTSSNQNEQKGIFNGKSGGGASKENNKANFKMEVGPDAEHLEEVTITSSQDLLYSDYFPREVGFSGVADTDWSQIGDVEVGNVSLAVGLNTIKFTRTDSYNIAVHDFVVAFDA